MDKLKKKKLVLGGKVVKVKNNPKLTFNIIRFSLNNNVKLHCKN